MDRDHGREEESAAAAAAAVATGLTMDHRANLIGKNENERSDITPNMNSAHINLGLDLNSHVDVATKSENEIQNHGVPSSNKCNNPGFGLRNENYSPAAEELGTKKAQECRSPPPQSVLSGFIPPTCNIMSFQMKHSQFDADESRRRHTDQSDQKMDIHHHQRQQHSLEEKKQESNSALSGGISISISPKSPPSNNKFNQQDTSTRKRINHDITNNIENTNNDNLTIQNNNEQPFLEAMLPPYSSHSKNQRRIQAFKVKIMPHSQEPNSTSTPTQTCETSSSRIGLKRKALLSTFRNKTNDNSSTTVTTTRAISKRKKMSSTTPSSNNTVQLFASDFDVTSIIQQHQENETKTKSDDQHNDVNTATSTSTSNPVSRISSSISKRPRRLIKQVIKYQPSTRNYKQEYKLHQMAGKVGTGFLCPGCNTHLSYDAKMCWSCELSCCYVPGTGVMVCKDRESIVKNDILKEKDILLDTSNDDYDDDDNNDRHISSTHTSKDLVRKSSRKKQLVTELASATPSTLSSSKVECESCLQLFQPTYIQRHRKTYHGLAPEFYGCPYCDSSYHTMRERIDHIQTKHVGKPTTKVPGKERPDALFVSNSTCVPIPSINSKLSTATTTATVAYLEDAIAECESCLQLFQSTYIQRHRKTYHALKPEVYGCPYCDTSYYTMEERIDHIQTKHVGQPHCIPAHVKALTKPYVYNCPYCTTTTTAGSSISSNPMTLTYSDLKNHLRKEHAVEMNHVLNEITTSCPFCISDNLRNAKTFKTVDLLLHHISLKHERCGLIGKKINIGDGGDLSEEEEQEEDLNKFMNCKGKGKNYYNDKTATCNFRKHKEIRKTLSTNEDNPNEKYWNDISFDDLRELFHLDKNVVKLGQTYDSLEHFIKRKLNKITYLEECHRQTQELNSGSNTKAGYADDEYNAENKLYIRGLRERAGKAASEALEKLTYKEQWEESNLKFQYENRNLKKSPEELEVELFVERPVCFVSEIDKIRPRRATRENNVCNVGEFCGLCNGIYASHIITDEEIEEAGGQITNVLPIGHDSNRTKEIRNLGFWKISDKDLPDDREEVNIEEGSSKRNKARTKNTIAKAAWMEYWKLLELKHAMGFVREYNKGLFLPTSSKKR